MSYGGITDIDFGDYNGMDEAAKLLGKGMGRTNLFKFLREKGILMKDNVPYQQYIDRGYFKLVKKRTFSRSYLVTLVSDSGMEFLEKLFKKDAGVNE